MRNVIIAPGEHYHIFNRGNNKQVIFFDDEDRARFLFLILYFQSKIAIPNIPRFISHFVEHRVFNISKKLEDEMVKGRYVELVAFVLMPNHFHLIIQELEENGTARYMQRVLNSYTKYFNNRYKKSGHLFQGPYKAVHVAHNRQLLYLSAYIHHNPKEIGRWSKKPDQYFWSSFQDYVGKNRWGEILQQDIISKQFKHPDEYRFFIKTSGAKDLYNVVGEELLIDLE